MRESEKLAVLWILMIAAVAVCSTVGGWEGSTATLVAAIASIYHVCCFCEGLGSPEPVRRRRRRGSWRKA